MGLNVSCLVGLNGSCLVGLYGLASLAGERSEPHGVTNQKEEGSSLSLWIYITYNFMDLFIKLSLNRRLPAVKIKKRCFRLDDNKAPLISR